MGFIRGGLLLVVSVLFFIILLLGNIFLVLSFSLKYENVQKELSSVIGNLTEDKFNITEGFNLTEEMDEAVEFMKEHCRNETSYVFAEGGYTFVIPCELLEEVEQNPQAIVEQGVENIIEQVYYDDYDCGFWDCFKKTGLPLFLVSEKAKNYWQDKFYLTLIAVAIIIVLIFFLVEHKQNVPIVVGSVLVLSSLPLLKLEKIISSIAGDSYLAFIRVFFNETGRVFWLVLVLGLIILAAGIILKFLQRNLTKKKFSKKDVQEIVKEEISKEKEDAKLKKKETIKEKSKKKK
jgi:hypothetical protein